MTWTERARRPAAVRRPPRRHLWPLAALLLLALVLSACVQRSEGIVTRDDDAPGAAAATGFSAAPSFPSAGAVAPTSSSSSSSAASPSSSPAVAPPAGAIAASAKASVGSSSASSEKKKHVASSSASGSRSGSGSGSGSRDGHVDEVAQQAADGSLAGKSKAPVMEVAVDPATATATAKTSATTTTKTTTAAATTTTAADAATTATGGSSSTDGEAMTTVQVTELHTDEGRGGVSIRGDYIEDDLESIDIPSSLFEIVDKDSGGRRQNYALLDAGATILDSSPETKSPTNLLVPDKDRYMLIPCEKTRKWVVVSLSEDVHADAIAIANYEKFSSPVKEFIVLGSVNYPTDTWFVLGNFTATHTNGEQVFQLDSQYHVRYIKLRFFSHYGSEYYCTLSQLKVFGRTFTQVISQLEKSIDAEASLDATALPLPPPKEEEIVETSTPGGLDTEFGASPSLSDASVAVDGATAGQCRVLSSPPAITTVFFDEVQQEAYQLAHGICRLNEDSHLAPAAGDTKAHALDGQTQHASASSEQKDRSASSSGDTTLTGSDVQHTGVNGTSVPGSTTIDAAGGSPVKANATTTTTTPIAAAPAAPSVPASGTSAGASTQGLGRLESIFVRITKKIQALELNQSVFGRQMEDFQVQQRAATRNLQVKQDSLTEQLKEIRALLTDLKGTVSKELSGMEKTLTRYGRILEEVQRENIALWNEMLIVREVITTMKAGILCAIVLSAFIITFYMLRLLFRCVAACKQRADLREWFWRMENQASSAQEAAANASPAGNGSGTAAGAMSPGSDVGAGSLRVNRKQQFGSSWDDSAIERKTLMSDMVDGPQRFRRHRTKKSRTVSLTYGPTIQRIVK